MKKLVLAGLLATLSVPLISSASDTPAPRQFSATEIAYIKNINCDTFTGTSKTYCLSIKAQAMVQSGNTGATLSGTIVGSGNIGGTTQTGSASVSITASRKTTPPPSWHERDGDRGTQTGTTLPKPPMPPVKSGSGDTSRGIFEGIGKLSPADRETLIKMIREYLISKGVTISDRKEMKQEIRDIKDTTKQEIKDTREAAKKEIEKKRDIMKEALEKKREVLKTYRAESRTSVEIGNQ